MCYQSDNQRYTLASHNLEFDIKRKEKRSKEDEEEEGGGARGRRKEEGYLGISGVSRWQLSLGG